MKILKSGLVGLLAIAAFCGCMRDRIDEGVGEQNPRGGKILHASAGAAQEGVLLVKLSEEAADQAAEGTTRSGATRSGIETFDVALDEIQAGTLEPVFVITEKNEANMRAAGLHRWYTVRFDDVLSLDAAAERLAQVSEVSLVQHNVWIEKNFHSTMATPSDMTAAGTRGSTHFNDPQLGYQWHYKNTGDESLVTPIKAGADVNLEPAWEICAGDPSIIVAICDEAVAYDHEDLAANMWINQKELDGFKGRDDDGNGYPDDIYGYNFGANKGAITWNSTGDTGHGTHVGGTVAAVNNNGLGVSGVAGGTGNNDGVKLMSAQLWSGNGNRASLIQIANAFAYAADNGASIIQCSWGAASKKFSSDEAYVAEDGLQVDAMNYFISTPRPGSPLNGGLVVFSSGNNGNICSYPSAYHTVVCVTSFSPDYTPSEFTNFGDRADIAAPGGDGTEYYKYAAGAAHRGEVLSTLPKVFGGGYEYPTGYGYMAGTSMAAPHVSGVAALGLSYAKKLGRTFTPDEFRTLLLGAVNDLDPYLVNEKVFTTYTDSQGFRHQSPMILKDYAGGMMGSGMVDAYKMLMAVRGTPAITVAQGEEATISLAKYYGDVTTTMAYTFNVPADVQAKLGMTVTKVDDFTVKIKCTNQSAGITTITSSIGQTPLSRELAIVCRSKVASNGGWL